MPVVGRKLCTVWLFHQITAVPSETVTYAGVFFDKAHYSGPSSIIYARSRPLGIFHLQKSNSHLKGSGFQDVEEFQENTTKQLHAIPQKRISGIFQ